MRWGAAIATVLVSVGSVFAEDAAKTGTTLTREEARERMSLDTGWLSLEDVTSLTAEVAAALAEYGGQQISFPSLKSLAPDVATALSNYKGELSLDGLEELSVETAQALAKHEGRLCLKNISSLPDDAARALSKHRGDLCMQGLRELRCEPLARQLLIAADGFSVGGDGGLDPYSLTTISPEVAELLVIKEQDRDGLSFYELKSPTLDVLRVLVRLNGYLHVGVVSLTPDMARVLAAHSGNLSLRELKDIDEAVLETLLKKEGGLALSLSTISPSVATLLAGFRGGLWLDNEKLSEDTERRLANGEGNSLFMPELKEIKTGALARKLVESRASLTDWDFVGMGVSGPEHGWSLAIEDVSLAVAEQLKAFRERNSRGRLVLRNLKIVSPEVAEALTECQADLLMPALQELKSEKLALKLAACSEDVAMPAGMSQFGSSMGLDLSHVTDISPDAAKALASHEGEYLLLDGIKSLSDNAAAGLAQFAGNLSLARVPALSAEAQRLLGWGKVKRVRLSSLDALTDVRLAAKIVDVQGLKTITAEVAAVFAKRSSEGPAEWLNAFGAGVTELQLNLSQLTPDIAAALATTTGNIGHFLILPALETIDAASATELAKCGVQVRLPGLRKLTPEIAAAFANNRYQIVLDGVEEIPVEVARVLATTQSGRITFRSPFNRRKEPLKLPDESAALLRKNSHVTLPPKLDQ
jgi:hypothetical protein